MEIHGTNVYGGVILNNAITWRRFNDLGQSRDLFVVHAPYKLSSTWQDPACT